MIRDGLQEFGRASALGVNFAMSKLFVSPINGVEVSMLSSTRGTPLTDNLGTYILVSQLFMEEQIMKRMHLLSTCF